MLPEETTVLSLTGNRPAESGVSGYCWCVLQRACSSLHTAQLIEEKLRVDSPVNGREASVALQPSATTTNPEYALSTLSIINERSHEISANTFRREMSASIQKFLSRISEEARVTSLREYSGFGWSILIDAVQMIHASQEDLLPSNRRGRVEAFIQFVRGNRLVVA